MTDPPLIYLDHNATTPVAPEVLQAMLPYLQDRFGNPSSGHAKGTQAAAAVARARDELAGLLNAEPDEITFTSGGTEADHLALLGALGARGVPGAHVVTTAIEHPAVLEPLRALRGDGLRLTEVAPAPDGVVSAAAVLDAVTPDTALVSVMLANNEFGTLQPVAEIAGALRDRGILIHTDAAQAVGKIPVDVRALGVDLLSLAGHKMYAPKGIGALWVRCGTPITPLLRGGGQEHGLRPGTEPVPGIVALGAAAALAASTGLAAATEIRRLRDRLEAALTTRLPRVTITGRNAPRLPGTSHLRIHGVAGAELLARIPELAASTGSACHTGAASPTLAAIGLDVAQATEALRLSLGIGTTAEEVQTTIDLITAHARIPIDM